MMFKSRISLAVATAVLALAGCHSNNSAPAVSGPVAATVNGVPISKERVDMIVKQRTMQGAPDTPEARKQIIEQLALQTLASEEALKNGLDKTPEVSSQLDMARRSILANAFVENYMKTHPTSDAMLSAEYDKVKAQMSGTEYKARHILVDNEAEAKDIIAKVKKDPKAFDTLAKEKSKDPGSKNNGGELGWFDARQMVPEFSNAVAKLSKGQITDAPVKSSFGYHVIMLEDSRPKEAPPMEQVKPMLVQQMQQQNLKKLLDEMKSKAKIDIVEVAATTPAAPAASAPAAAPAPKQ